MPDPIQGRPGTTFVNKTRRVLYQLRVSGFNTCSWCWSLDGKVAEYWGPQHRGCRCESTPIYPGDSAPAPFVDYRKALNKLSAGEKSAAVGSSVARLVRAGLIGWGDTVGDHGARSLASIIAAKHLTLKKLLKAGIPLWIARRAIEQSKGEGKPEPEPRPGFFGRIGQHARRILHRFTGLFGGPLSTPPLTPATPGGPALTATAGAVQAAGFIAALGAIRDRRRQPRETR